MKAANYPHTVIAWSVISMEVGQTGSHFLPLNTTINGPLYPDVTGLYINFVRVIFKDDQTSCLMGVPPPWENSRHMVQQQEIPRPCQSFNYHVIFGQIDFVINSVFFFFFFKFFCIFLPPLSYFFPLRPYLFLDPPTFFYTLK